MASRNGRTTSPKPNIWIPHHKANGKGIRKPEWWLAESSNGAILIYGLTTVLLALTTKYAVSGLYWNLNFCFIFVQSSISIAFMVLLRHRGVITGVTAFDRRKALMWAPLSLLLVIMSYISLKALQFLSLPTHTILTNIVIMTIAYTERGLTGTDNTSNFIMGSFALILLSVTGGVWTDYDVAVVSYGDKRLIQTLEPNNPIINLLIGCVLMLAYILLATFHAKMVRRITKKTSFKDWDVIWYNNLFMIPIAGTLSYLIEDFSGENLNDNFRIQYRVSTILSIIATSLLAAYLPYTSFRCKEVIGKNKYSLIDASNKFSVAFSGLLIFGNNAGVVDGIEPVVFGGAGAFMYAWGKLKVTKEERKEGLLPSSLVRGRIGLDRDDG